MTATETIARRRALSRGLHVLLTAPVALAGGVVAAYLLLLGWGWLMRIRWVSDFEREHGLHRIDISNANPTVDTFELPVCFVVRDPGWQDSPGTRVPGCRQPGAAAGRAWPPT